MDTFSKIILFFLKKQLSGWSDGSIIEQRKRQEKSLRFLRLPKEIHCEEITEIGVPAEWIDVPNAGKGIILYLHGGAYALGSINSHRELISRLVNNTNCRALAINYRLAPENPFPAALEDSLQAYNWLLSNGYEPSQICLAGDSAGGGLAISTLIALREKGIPIPAGVVCFSPWLDLTLSGKSIIDKKDFDPILSGAILEKYINDYIGDHQADDPLISPLFADLKGLPPMLIHTGRNEILLDDSIRFYEKARKAGVDVSLKIWNDMFHVFQLFSFFPATQESMKLVSLFVNRVLFSFKEPPH